MSDTPYICSVHIVDIINTALTYWELDKNNWIVINNNLASHIDSSGKQSSLCVYSYPTEDGPRINYIKDNLIKSAWINENKNDHKKENYFLSPRTI